MLKYIAKRILQAVPIIFAITVVCFALIQAAPFDAIDMLTRPDMPVEMVAALKAHAGLDKSPIEQYFAWLVRVLHGDFGYSIVNHESVSATLAARLPNTIILVLPAYLLSLFLSIVLGLTAGANYSSPVDKLIDGICAVGMATPTFWVGMLLLYFFSYALNLLPVLGMYTMGQAETTGDLLRHLILPCTVLTLGFLPDNTRYIRSGTISQFREDYVMVQRAFGAGKAEILRRHVLKNVLLPVITLVGMSLPMLVTGAFITEALFSWPGVGTYFFTAIKGFDYPAVMAVLLMSSTMVITGNLLADILCCIVDPRISLASTYH